MHQERSEAQEQGPRDKRSGQAELPAQMLLLFRQPICCDGNEYNVIHAQHNFQKNKRDKADPRFSCEKY